VAAFISLLLALREAAAVALNGRTPGLGRLLVLGTL
jgi:hypothetical protein